MAKTRSRPEQGARPGLDALAAVPPHERHVLLAGPTASGKSDLALEIAESQGGTIVNADALQVYECWRVLTARPDAQTLARAPHRLYGHVPCTTPYSVGNWLRELGQLLATSSQRLIITGGTGLYFTALTEGLAQIPPVPPALRRAGERRLEEEGLATLLDELDAPTRARIDTANPARVLRAWEVLHATGRGLRAWQEETGPPLLPLEQVTALVLDPSMAWLEARIAARLDAMIAHGALEEVRAQLTLLDSTLPAARAIGAAELAAHLRGETTLDAAVAAARTATRRYAKRQRTWMRNRMAGWQRLHWPPQNPDAGGELRG